ncbi:MAG: hypothetical protein ACXV2G_11635 [Actinomycetes bacterium]
MTSHPGSDRSGARDLAQDGGPPPPGPAPADAAHLDEDPEALEDPVHEGDARHQHERHEPGSGHPGQAG